MEGKPYKIVVAESYEESAIQRLREVAEVEVLSAYDNASLLSAVADCSALLVRSYAQVTKDVIKAAPNLKVIGRGGVGLDNVDVEAAQANGVQVVYTPAAATDSVADLAVSMMLALLRRLPACDQAVREGRFSEARSESLYPELSSITVGIIGMGRIGRAVGRRCRCGFGMTVLYNDIVSPGLLDYVAEPVSKDELFSRSDVVTLHVPHTPLTHQLIGAESLGKFKREAFLVNTARGKVVDSVALAEALTSGSIAGAALDVFDPEPLPVGHALFEAPATILTPHVAARTAPGLARMNNVVDDVVLVLEGKQPAFPAWE